MRLLRHPVSVIAGVAAAIALLAAAAGLFASSPEPTLAQPAPGSPIPTEVFECFRVFRGDTPNAAVRLTTKNFGPDVAVVREANRYCEWANKYIDPPAGTELVPPPQERALQCWALRKGQDPDDDVILETRNFGKHVATVRTAVAMCENAVKVTPDGVTYGAQDARHVFQCFKLDTKARINKRAVLVTENFGVDNAYVVRPELFCESALKERPNHEPFGAAESYAFECFTIEARNRGLAVTLLTRNFGADDLIIQRGTLLCEEARKTHIIDDPAGGGGTDPT